MPDEGGVQSQVGPGASDPADEPRSSRVADIAATSPRSRWWTRGRRRAAALGLGSLAVLGGIATVSGYTVRDFVDYVPSVVGLAPEVTSTPAASPTQAGVWGWGPDRSVFSDSEAGPLYPVLNSVIGNAVVGDERNFLTIKDASVTTEGGWVDRVRVEDGHQYALRVYVRNDGPAYEGDVPPSWVHDVRLMINLQAESAPSQGATAILDGENVEEIWDSVTMWNDRPFRMIYEPGNATLYSNAHPTPGLALSTDILTSHGVPLGYDEMDGVLRPGYQYALYIYVVFRVEVD